MALFGVATVSTEDRHWEPWTGHRTVRPNILGPAIPIGANIRNRVCFNDNDRVRRAQEREGRIKHIVGEAADAARLDGESGSGGQGPCELDDTKRGEECAFADDYYDSDPFGHGSGHVDHEFQEDGGDKLVCDEEAFWHSLDENAVPVPDVIATETLELLQYDADASGLSDAIIDTADGLLNGTIVHTDRIMSALDRCIDSACSIAPSTFQQVHSSTPAASARDRLEAIRERIAKRPPVQTVP
jgi:hypothetical protein